MLKGYDISSFQGNIDNRVVPGDFVFVKMSEGNIWIDPDCDANVQQSLSAGKKVGGYHVGRPDGNPAADEARALLANIQGYIGKLVIALDIEPQYIPAGCDLVAWVLEWCDTFFAGSYVTPVVYLNESLANSYDWSPVWGKYALWVAGYGLDLPQNGYVIPAAPTVNGDWNIALFQYSSKTVLPGWSGYLDADVFYGDASAWDKYAAQHPPVAPAPAPAPQPAPAPVVAPAPAPVPTPVPVSTPPTPAVPTIPSAPLTASDNAPVVTPAPVVAPEPIVAPVAPEIPKVSLSTRISTTVTLIKELAALQFVKDFLRTIFSGHNGIGRTVRGALQVISGLTLFAYMVVSLPGFAEFWSSNVGTAIAAPATVISAVTAAWNGVEAIIGYIKSLNN